MKTFLSVDLGAGSGRVIAARFDGGKLAMETVSRFDNSPVELDGHIYWNIPSLMNSIRDGLAAAHAKYGEIASVGIDTWGVDFAFLDKSGRMLGLPCAYRDSRNSAANAERTFAKVGGRRALYNATGIQMLDLNTVFQLNAEREEPDSMLDKAARILFIPDLINYFLCGEAAIEATIASTSQLVDINTRGWSDALLAQIGVPRALLSDPAQPGTVLGKIRGVAGLEGVPLCLVGSHDTASAIASIPADGSRRWGYIATGTWALVGAENSEPIISDASYECNYSHEGAVNGKFRFLRNCAGMWMIQELRRAWSGAGQSPDFDTLMREATAAEPFRYKLNPDSADFFTPGNMPAKVAEYCRRTGQGEPRARGEFYRATMEGVVMRCREVWGGLEKATGVKREVAHIIGGAIKDEMFCRMLADALNVELACGPAEGASMGNALAQMVASGDLRSFDEGRALIARSTEMKYWQPESPHVWDEAFEKWQAAKESC